MTLKEIAIELLEKYEASESVAICEYSTNINKDMNSLDKEVKAYRKMIDEADRKTENCSEKPNNCEDCIWSVCNYNKAFEDEPQTYITEDRDTQILDAWQVHHRSTTSVEDKPQTERSER